MVERLIAILDNVYSFLTAIMFFTHTLQMIGINTTISGNAHIPKRSYVKELI